MNNQSTQTAEFLDKLQSSITDGTLVKLTLGKYRGADVTLKNVFVRPIILRRQPYLSFLFRHTTKDITTNFLPAECVSRVALLLENDFQTAHLFTTGETVELKRNKKGQSSIHYGKPRHSSPPALRHDRQKQRLITPQNSPWLQALGVTTTSGTVCAGMEAKFRQINKFIEILAALFTERPKKRSAPLRLVDMGCGKGYLTFGAATYLQRSGLAMDARGIEERIDLVKLGNQVVQDYSLTGLKFECGSIEQTPVEGVDVLIALHACDSATDDAIAKGIAAGASLILVAPCCHKELRRQLRPLPAMAPAFKHGILRERQAELVTDILRALLLEWAGYTTKVFEFITTEHTAKNLMITAVKHPGRKHQEATAKQVRDYAAVYGLKTQQLARHLNFSLIENAARKNTT